MRTQRRSFRTLGIGAALLGPAGAACGPRGVCALLSAARLIMDSARNQTLSRSRARTVTDLLLEASVRPDRLRAEAR